MPREESAQVCRVAVTRLEASAPIHSQGEAAFSIVLALVGSAAIGRDLDKLVHELGTALRIPEEVGLELDDLRAEGQR